jgi:hypothetical protein
MFKPSTTALFTQGYITALLWSSVVTDSAGEDFSADAFEISPAAADTCRADCEAFFQANAADIHAAAQVYGYEHAGHDFALTRNGHGAGYWDGDLPDDLGERLTEAAKRCGELSPYLGDDDLIHI